MLQIAICDDNPLHLAHASAVVEQELAAQRPAIEGFPDAAALLRRVREEGYAPDIAILDIEMEGNNGIELAEALNQQVPRCRIIFLTGYAEHASEVYKTKHIWLVLKSRMEDYMGPALRKALDKPDTENSCPALLLKSRGETRRVPLREILYLSRVGRRAQIVTHAGSFFSPRRPTELITEELSDSFLRCHQGYWVNLEKITALEREEFLLEDGSRIPISRSCRDAARARFFERYHL